MANYRVQVVGVVKSGDASRDYTTNVLYYAAPTTTASAIGGAVLSAFTGGAGPYNTFYNVQVKVYDKANPLHSPPVSTSNFNGSGMSSPGPRQVALCLSFYSGLNVRGQRGRIYVGPWAASSIGEFASPAQLTNMQTLAGALKHPGGADVIHMIYHPRAATYSNVSNYFINNRWDTMRSRLPKETSRVTA